MTLLVLQGTSQCPSTCSSRDHLCLTLQRGHEVFDYNSMKLHDSKVLESEAMPSLPNVSCCNTKPVQQYIFSIWWILTLVSFILDLQASVLDLYLAQRVCYKPHHHSCLDMYRDSKPVNSDRISNQHNQVLSLRPPLNILNIYPLMMISWHNPLSISTKGGIEGSGQVSLSRGWHMTAVVLNCKEILKLSQIIKI